MDLESRCPLPAAQIVWQRAPARWALTLVCKATYGLEPGVAVLADEQEGLVEEDRHWEDDPGRSLLVPGDLAPMKARADVVLVGNAYARDGVPVRSLVARLSAGKVDKSIEVLASRAVGPGGQVREGKRWTKMALLWERAAGGPGTENPVGIWPGGGRESPGEMRWPNLQPPGFPIGGGQLPPPIGFGPIAASWPLRKGKAPRGAEREWALAPFGEGFDVGYFQVAPADQQTDPIRPNERITLENLHPRHARLVTRLPGVVPAARVEPRSGRAREMGLLADTLWIDTRRGICTVCYRGNIDVEHPEVEGRILLTMERREPSRSAPPPLFAPLPGTAPPVAPPPLFGTPPATLPPSPPPLLGTPPATLPPSPLATLLPSSPLLLGTPLATLPPSPLATLPPSPPAPPPLSPPEPPGPERSRSEPAPKPGSIPAAPAIELVWFDAGCGDTLLGQTAFQTPPRAVPDDTPRDRARLALTHGTPATPAAIEAALYTAEAHSPPAPAVVMVTGTLEMGLDGVELLKATAFAAGPLAGSDRRLKEALDLANDVLRVPVPAMPDVLEAITARVREAWAKANPLLPADHLAVSAERMLLEQRRYQRRELMGETWLRALLGGAGWERPLPIYVPESSVKSLPIYRRFTARVVGEVVWQQDPLEAHPLALRALAIARLPPRGRWYPRRAHA